MTHSATNVRSKRSGRERGTFAVVLGSIWVIDGLLQCQSIHFTPAFPDDLSSNAMAQPPAISDFLVSVAHLVAHHVAFWNGAFALVELALGVGIIVWRSRRTSLRFSVIWALAVWVLGEGLGNIATGFAMVPFGFPGAALLYGAVALLLLIGGWRRPVRSGRSGDGAVAGIASVVWSVLWLGGVIAQAMPVITPGLKYAADAQALADDEPTWLAHLDRVTGHFLSGRAIGTTVILCFAEAMIGLAPWLAPRSKSSFFTVLVVLAGCSLFGENFGGILSGSAYDLGAMPLYALLAAMIFIDGSSRPAQKVQPASLDQTVPSELATAGA